MVRLHPPAKGIHLREKVAEDHDADHMLGVVPSLLCKFRVSFIRINRVGPGLMRERGHLGGRWFTSNGQKPGKPYRQLSERR